MLKFLLPALLFAFLPCPPALSETIGFRELTLPDAVSGKVSSLKP